MKRSNDTHQDYDDRLADFADRVLSRQLQDIESNADDELRGLEETILHLRRSMPQESVSQETLKRLRSDFVIRSQSRSRDQNEKNPIMSLLDRMMRMEINPNLILTVGAMAVLAGVFVLALFSNGAQPGTLPATAGSGSQITGITILAGGMFLLILVWISRRK